MDGAYARGQEDWRVAEELLGLTHPYGESDVSKAYRRAMLRCHPDLSAGKTNVHFATEQASRINWAREILLNRIRHTSVQGACSREGGVDASGPREKVSCGSWQSAGHPRAACADTNRAYAGRANAWHAGAGSADVRQISGFAVPAPRGKATGGNGSLVAGLVSLVCLLDCVLHVLAFSSFGLGQDYSMFTLDFGYAIRVLWTYLLEPPVVALSALAACLLARYARAEAGGALPSRARVGRFLGRLSVPALCASFVLINDLF